MEKTLGPKGGQAGSGGTVDEFNTVKQIVNDTITTIRKKMDEKDQKIARFGSNVDTLKMGAEIKDRLIDLDRQLGQMNEVLRKQKRDRKRYGVSELEVKEKHYNNFLTQLKDLKARERGALNPQEPQIKTLLEAKSDFYGKLSPRERGPERDLTVEEAAALETFKENDQKQDELIDQINNGLETLAGKARNIGDQVDRQANAIDDLDKEIDVAYVELESSNARLKKVLVEYRKPGKFCMDICLLIVLLGLIGVIIKCF